MNRAERAKEYFLARLGQHVSKKALAEAGISDFYVVRNAVAEAKSLLGDGYDIVPENKDAGTCGYRCVKISGEVQSVAVSSPLCQESTGESERTHGAEAVNSEPTPPPIIYFDTKKKKQQVWNFGNPLMDRP